MSERTSIVNISGDHEETLTQLARHLGTNKIRRKVFNAIYGRGSKPRSKKQIIAAASIPNKDAQQVQNELDHLTKHHLVVRVENDGSVRDRSRYLYQKDASVRANRASIVRYADNRKAAANVPTKRRPLVQRSSAVSAIKKRDLKKKKHLKVLYLTADPDEAKSIRVDAEVRQVQQAVRGSAFRDNITILHSPAADLDSLMEGLNDHRPQIVHFSGHGYSGGIATDSGSPGKRSITTVSFDLLAKALAATDDPPEIIVLNSCKSSSARKSFLPPGKIVVVMRDSVSDVAAIAFATKFYAAIAGGQSMKAAFGQGKVAVETVSINEADTPELFSAAGTNPAKITLA
ncbi:MAG TPA: CHAT domain-containing protein [Roseiarcus sp.]|jgi:hypothetical protein